jgi:hypothetical protein
MELPNNLNHQAGGAAADVRCKQLFIKRPAADFRTYSELSGEVKCRIKMLTVDRNLTAGLD